MGKICIKCGEELEDNALFCDNCGEKQLMQNVENQSKVKLFSRSDIELSDNELKQSTFGIVSLVLGIISIVTFGILFIPEILGVLFGVLGICEKDKKKGFALAGLIMSGIMVLFILIAVIMIA